MNSADLANRVAYLEDLVHELNVEKAKLLLQIEALKAIFADAVGRPVEVI